MSQRHSRIGWGIAVTLSIIAVSACSSDRDLFVGQDCPNGFCDDDATFGSSDGGTDGEASTSETPKTDVPMCAVTTCTSPRTTCPTSAFPCDVDLSNDNENCGGCGIRCGTAFDSNWRCVEGKCQFACGNADLNDGIQGADCDDDPTNGCEVNTLLDGNNCGACGYVCPDSKMCFLGTCYSLCDLLGLPDECGAFNCTDKSRDDANCGACGNACDPTGPNLDALPSDMHYGCGGGSCGVSKCNDGTKANCNGDRTDGCETSIHTNDNCAGCGDACAPGKECLLGDDNTYHCTCEDDSETLCGSKCQLLDQDPYNCGACNNACPGAYSPHFVPTCSKGVCGGRCEAGYADCDGLPGNGCESDIRIDSRHCGACGRSCAPGQVCADGECLVTPCDAGSETPTK